ncbi:MAG: hypothetical protein ABJA66_13955, partial [Actinomycetota bacterium]
MIHQLEFEKLIEYDTGKSGISLDVNLKLIGREIPVSTKIDTGSTNCIFARSIGEMLGLEIESGELVRVSSAVGHPCRQRWRAPIHNLWSGWPGPLPSGSASTVTVAESPSRCQPSSKIT